MDKTAALAIARRYSDRVRRRIPIRKIVLFGSQLRGAPREDSDIDIAVVVHGLREDFLDVAAELYRLRSDIDVRIEPVLLDEIRDRSGFLEEVMRTGEVVYSSGEEDASGLRLPD